MNPNQAKNTRYGVEIKGITVHAECDELAQVLALLQGHAGVVRVFDRQNQSLVLDGTVQDVQVSLRELNGGSGSAETTPDPDTDPDTGHTHPIEDLVEEGLHAVAARVTAGLNIAAAYYHGDLANVTRKVDLQGKPTFQRATRKGPRRILGIP